MKIDKLKELIFSRKKERYSGLSSDLKTLISSYNSLEESDRIKIVEFLNIPREITKMSNPGITQEEILKFHNHLVDSAVEWCKNNNNTIIDNVELTINNLQPSVEFGKWCPSTDSCLSLEHYDNDERKIIGTSI